ncbi:MAG: hypothetical protein ACNA7J_12730, partial [Wenzhouxiangella sp.]
LLNDGSQVSRGIQQKHDRTCSGREKVVSRFETTHWRPSLKTDLRQAFVDIWDTCLPGRFSFLGRSELSQQF